MALTLRAPRNNTPFPRSNEEDSKTQRAMMNSGIILGVILGIVGVAVGSASAGTPDSTALTKAHDAIHGIQHQATVEVSGKLSRIKTEGLKAVVPVGKTLTVDTSNPVRFELLNVKGELKWTGQQPRLRASTLIIDHTGKVTGSPTNPDQTRTVSSTRPDGTLNDPSHVGGGVIGMAGGWISGSDKMEQLQPITLTAKSFTTRERLHGWRPNDWVCIPAVEAGVRPEYRRIKITSGGILFDSPLERSHVLPDGTVTPVFNLTRNVRFVSEDRTFKPHVMWMGPPQTIGNIEIDGYGRSDASIPGDKPFYGEHIHRVIGPATEAGWNFINHVIWDSVDHSLPKYGIVNHGDRLFATRCVVAGAVAAGFYEENGLGQGEWNRCTSIDAQGLTGAVKGIADSSRSDIDDVVFDGFGFAQHGGTMTLADCASYGAKTAGFFSYGLSNKETGDINLNVGKPISLQRFTAIGSEEGFRIKYHEQGLQSEADDCRVLNCNQALNTHYVWAGFKLTRSDLWVVKGFENAANTGTNFEFSDNTVHDHSLGFDVPTHGLAIDSIVTISGNTFDPGDETAVDVRLRQGDAFTVNGFDTTIDADLAVESVQTLNTRIGSRVVVEGP